MEKKGWIERFFDEWGAFMAGCVIVCLLALGLINLSQQKFFDQITKVEKNLDEIEKSQARSSEMLEETRESLERIDEILKETKCLLDERQPHPPTSGQN